MTISFTLIFLFLVLFAVVLTSSLSAESDEDVKSFASKEDLNQHMQKLNSGEKAKEAWDAPPSDAEMIELRKEELRVRLAMEDIVKEYGKQSFKYAEQLHKLGRSLYKQHRFEEVFTVSQEIVELHEKLDGFEHENTGRALGNLGSAAFRLKRTTDCENAMNRALYIWIQKYGDQSKEVLLHRGKMLTFRVPFAQTSGGISYDDYLYNEL